MSASLLHASRLVASAYELTKTFVCFCVEVRMFKEKHKEANCPEVEAVGYGKLQSTTLAGSNVQCGSWVGVGN
ncbi:hypothetical protein RJT34_20690 [Clitoria ternatea]|uniref:Uncharacterized protein n=1 Tax=Clitoria ternatea TaxID=43366 RepID=A0AAN9P577_CLITE